jgi:hypothetical protein
MECPQCKSDLVKTSNEVVDIKTGETLRTGCTLFGMGIGAAVFAVFTLGIFRAFIEAFLKEGIADTSDLVFLLIGFFCAWVLFTLIRPVIRTIQSKKVSIVEYKCVVCHFIWGQVTQNKNISPEIEKEIFARMNDFEKVQVEKLVDQHIISLYKSGWLDSTLRANAAKSLGYFKSERGVQPLLQALEKEKDTSAIHEMILALGKIGDCKAVPVLVGYLRNGDPNVRKSAANALGIIGNEQACNDLTHALADENKDVGEAARAALDEIMKNLGVPSTV